MLEYKKKTSPGNNNKRDQQRFQTTIQGIRQYTGKKDKNQLPMGSTNSQLAEDFADFFLNKIDRIREEVTNIPAYQPNERDTPKLKKFTPITQSQLEKTIKGLPTKSCQLNVIPMDKLKKGTRRLFTSINPYNEWITRNKPFLQWMEGSTGQTADKKNNSWLRKIKLQTSH